MEAHNNNATIFLNLIKFSSFYYLNLIETLMPHIDCSHPISRAGCLRKPFMPYPDTDKCPPVFCQGLILSG